MARDLGNKFLPGAGWGRGGGFKLRGTSFVQSTSVVGMKNLKKLNTFLYSSTRLNQRKSVDESKDLHAKV